MFGPPSRLRPLDLAAEILASLVAAPARTIGIMAGVLLAAAAFVSARGLSATLSQQVSSAFDAARATEINVQGRAAADRHGAPTCPALALQAARQIPGVTAGGRYLVLSDQPVTDALPGSRGDRFTAPVIGVDAGSQQALGITLSQGRLPDPGHLTRGDPVAILPAALRSEIPALSVGSAVRVNGRLLLVIGFSTDTLRRPEARAAVIVPALTAQEIWSRSVSPEQVTCGALFSTEPGAASVIAGSIRLVLDPTAQAKFTIIAPPDPQGFRRSLERSVRLLADALAAVALAIGTISIAAGAASAVRGRTAEIGLRKAIGARSRHVLVQLVAESSAIGLLGGLFGSLIGMLVTVVTSLWQHWTPVLDLTSAALAVLGATLVGSAAGVVPALRAAATAPAHALRR